MFACITRFCLCLSVGIILSSCVAEKKAATLPLGSSSPLSVGFTPEKELGEGYIVVLDKSYNVVAVQPIATHQGLDVPKSRNMVDAMKHSEHSSMHHDMHRHVEYVVGISFGDFRKGKTGEVLFVDKEKKRVQPYFDEYIVKRNGIDFEESCTDYANPEGHLTGKCGLNKKYNPYKSTLFLPNKETTDITLDVRKLEEIIREKKIIEALP